MFTYVLTFLAGTKHKKGFQFNQPLTFSLVRSFRGSYRSVKVRNPCDLKHLARAARLVVRASPSAHTTLILARFHWLPVQARISYKIACLCFSSINSSAPAYLSDIFHLYSPARPLRSSADTRLLKLPLYKHKTKGDRAFLSFWLFCLELTATTH